MSRRSLRPAGPAASPGARRPLLRALLAAAALAAAALAPVAGAQAATAAPAHAFFFSIRGVLKEPGHVPVPPPEGEFEDACGVAVDAAGDIYVADYHHHAIDVYTPSQEYLAQIADPDPDGPCNLALDDDPTSPSFGDLYVDNWRRDVVRYAPSAFPPSATTTWGAETVIDFPTAPGARSTGVAVDPQTGSLYVDDRTQVSVFEAAALAEAEPRPSAVLGLGTLGQGYGIAVSDFPATAGEIYVPDASAGTVAELSPTGALLGEIDGAGTPQRGFVSLADSDVAVDQTDGHLYVADDLQPGFETPAAVVDEFNPSGDYRGQLPRALVDAGPSALATDAAGDVYVTSGDTEEASVVVFGPTLAAHTLTVTTTGAGEGTVTSEPAGIDCGTACAAEYDSGEEVVLTAVPAPGSVFAGFSGACAGTAPCHVRLTADATVGAGFEPAPPAPLVTGRSAVAGTAAADAAGAAPPSAAGSALRLSRAQVSGSTATLVATVPGPGTLTASGPGLLARSLQEGAAGRTTLHLRLDRAGRRALARAKGDLIRVPVRVAFAPRGGGPPSRLRAVLDFRRGGGRGR